MRVCMHAGVGKCSRVAARHRHTRGKDSFNLETCVADTLRAQLFNDPAVLRYGDREQGNSLGACALVCLRALTLRQAIHFWIST